MKMQNDRGIEDSASHRREAADKPGPTESAQSRKGASGELSENPVGAQAHVTKQPGKEGGTQLSVNTNIRALRGLYFCQAGVIRHF